MNFISKFFDKIDKQIFATKNSLEIESSLKKIKSRPILNFCID